LKFENAVLTLNIMLHIAKIEMGKN